MEENLEEYQQIVDEVCEKYGYDSEDKEGNDSLRTVLLKLVPIMLKNRKPEDKQLFYEMLRHTPIVVTEKLTKEGYDKLVEQYIGNVNPHIVQEETDFGEYGKAIGAGAYVSEPIIDENMQLQGKKSFVYIQKVNSEKEKSFFGTDINVSHLEHELGHAWHAEKDQYMMQDDGTLQERVGTAKYIYSFSKKEDGQIMQTTENVTGLMIEETMNTIEEENAMAEYIGIPLEEMKKAYGEILISSNYQGYMSDTTRYMLQELHKDNFENWRLYGDNLSKSKIENLMSKTEYWKNREQDILPNSGSPRSYDPKREIIWRMESEKVRDFFREYETMYFPNIATMTPLEKVDNVLEQSYTMNMAKYSMKLDDYRDLLECMNWEVYSLINQTADLQKEEELANTIGNVRVSELNEITRQTKEVVRQQEQSIGKKAEEKGENR